MLSSGDRETGPPGGRISAGDRWALARLVPPDAADAHAMIALDVLLEAATSNEPDERPSMASLANELDRWIRGDLRPSGRSHLLGFAHRAKVLRMTATQGWRYP